LLRKKNRRFIPVLALTTTLLLAGCAAKTESKTEMSAANKDYIQSIYQGQEVTLSSPFSKIDISTDLFAVRIGLSQDELTHISLDTNAEQLEEHFDIGLQTNNDQLKLAIKGKKKLSLKLTESYKSYNSELVVMLPEQVYQEIELNSTAGTISYNHVNTDELRVKTDAGEIQVENAVTQQTKIENSVGLITVRDVKGKLDIQNSAGAVKLYDDLIQEDVQISTEVGAVNVQVAQEPEHYKLDLSTEIGKIDTNWNADFTANKLTTVQGTKGNSGPLVKIRTSVGLIKVNSST